MKKALEVSFPKSVEISKQEVKEIFKEFQQYVKEEAPVSLKQLVAWAEEQEESRAVFNALGGKTRELFRSSSEKDPFLMKGVATYVKSLGYKIYVPGDLVTLVALKEKR